MNFDNFPIIFISRPDWPRPIKVNILIPIFFVIICVVLVLVPSYYEPKNLGINILITLSGIPIYFLCVKWKNKPKRYRETSKSIERFCQLLFHSIFIDESS
jgi:solute carrier family 7 (L-type amino acid transporter), member 5